MISSVPVALNYKTGFVCKRGRQEGETGMDRETNLFLSNSDMTTGRAEGLSIRSRLFHEENMYCRMKQTALAEGLNATGRALRYMRERHAGQLRKQGRYTTDQVAYINHPLMMACQAHAFGIRDDYLLAAILLHDVVEDTGVSLEELPFEKEICTVVGLLTFKAADGMTKEEAKANYYEAIRSNGKACVVKLIDRCNNVSTMAASFSRKRMSEYISETEQYVLPLTDVIETKYPQYEDIAFLTKYHIVSVLETIKNLIAD
jgi:GTP pyrophosphokinase